MDFLAWKINTSKNMGNPNIIFTDRRFIPGDVYDEAPAESDDWGMIKILLTELINDNPSLCYYSDPDLYYCYKKN